VANDRNALAMRAVTVARALPGASIEDELQMQLWAQDLFSTHRVDKPAGAHQRGSLTGIIGRLSGLAFPARSRGYTMRDVMTEAKGRFGPRQRLTAKRECRYTEFRFSKFDSTFDPRPRAGFFAHASCVRARIH
jgi:hypothetical protein